MKRKISILSILMLSIFATSLSAQTISRLQSWDYLNSPPSPFKTFTTTDASYMLLNGMNKNGKLVKVEVDGTLTEMYTLMTSGHTSSDVVVKSSGETVVFSLAKGKSIYYYVTSGTPASSKLIYQYTMTAVRPPDFAVLNGKAYILTANLVEIDLASNTNKVLKAMVDYRDHYKLESDGQNLYVTYNIDAMSDKYALSRVDLATGDLSLVSDKLYNWDVSAPIIPRTNELFYWSYKDTTAMMNGSRFAVRRTLLLRFDPQTNTSQQIFAAGYNTASLPAYLGEIANKLYFFSNGDYDLSLCQSVGCLGNAGAYLWECTSQGTRIVKKIASTTEGYTYAGIKQVASDKIYLELKTQTEGKEAWVATPTDLYLLNDFNPGAKSLKDYGLKLAEGATCGGNLAVPGIGVVTSSGDNELYLSDGTANNFYKFDVMPKAGLQSMPKGLVNVKDKIYFIAADSLLGQYGIAKTSLFSLDLCSNISQGVSNVHQSVSLRLYPNPTSGFVQIQSGYPIDKVEIVSVSGAVVYKSYGEKTTLNISSLNPGIYFMKVFHDKSVSITRFIKN